MLGATSEGRDWTKPATYNGRSVRGVRRQNYLGLRNEADQRRPLSVSLFYILLIFYHSAEGNNIIILAIGYESCAFFLEKTGSELPAGLMRRHACSFRVANRSGRAAANDDAHDTR